MKIEPFEFCSGAQFRITSETEAERILLIACSDPEIGVLVEDDSETEFKLTLAVSND